MSASARDQVGAVREVLAAYRFRYDCEKDLQDGIEQALIAGRVGFERECHLGSRGVIDFLARDGVGIEVKIDGTLAEVTRQLHRYAQHERVHGLLLVTSRERLAALPDELNGRPVAALALRGGLR